MKRSRTYLILAMTLFAACLIESDRAGATPIDPKVESVASNPQHAARLRKLHLVRPDLINYPLSFDVVC